MAERRFKDELVVLISDQRINHACRPNAFYRFNDYTLEFDVFALRDIQPGEELTFSCKPRLTYYSNFTDILQMAFLN